MNKRKLFLTYLKIGSLAFGGGYTMLPLLEREFIEKEKCVSEDELFQYFALSQSIPGIIAVNMATFLGYRLKGFSGALIAALGMMLPSIIIITVIAAFFQNFAEISWVQSIFRGLNISIIALIISVLWKLGKKNISDIVTWSIFLITLALYFITKWNPVFFIIFGILAGLLLAGRGKK